MNSNGSLNVVCKALFCGTRNKIQETKKAPIRIIPKPVKSSFDADHYVDLNDEHWKWVVCADEEFQKEAQHIASKQLSIPTRFQRKNKILLTEIQKDIVVQCHFEVLNLLPVLI